MPILHSETFPGLAYRKDGQGPAIVLIHGFPASGDLWKHIWPVLSSSYTLIVPDLPGAGSSKLPNKDMSTEVLAASINEILEQEGISEVIIVGHSMGGYAALAFAELYGSKLKGISLVHSVAAADNEEKKETRRKSVALIRKGGKETFIKQMIPNLFSPSFKATHASVMEEQVQSGLELAAESMIAYYNAMMSRPDRSEILEKAAYPVQFIIGKDDSVIPSDAALKQGKLANITFVSLYEHTGHMSMIENMGRLAADLGEFAQYCYKR